MRMWVHVTWFMECNGYMGGCRGEGIGIDEVVGLWHGGLQAVLSHFLLLFTWWVYWVLIALLLSFILSSLVYPWKGASELGLPNKCSQKVTDCSEILYKQSGIRGRVEYLSLTFQNHQPLSYKTYQAQNFTSTFKGGGRFI